jgi:leucyl-tRNA synthetase
VNAVGEAERAPADAGMSWARHEAITMLVRLASPMIPHLAEEVHALLRPDSGLVAELPWPEADPDLLVADSVTIAVQVMGKLRATISVPPNAAPDTVIAAAEAEPNVARLLEGKRIVKRVHVPNRIVNFVVAG